MITVTLQAGFGSTMLDGSPTWTTLAKVRHISSGRGRSSVDQRFETGTGSAVIDNRDGDFDQFNTAGAHYPNVKIGVPVRCYLEIDGESGTFPVFYYQARSWKPSYPKGNIDSTVTVTLADGFYTLENQDLAGQSYPHQRTDERITAVLDDIGWPAALRDLDTGVANVQAIEFAAPGDGGDHSALAHLLDVAESEAGVLFMSAEGEVTFRNRVAQAQVASGATYTGSDYSEIDPKPDDTILYNIIKVARKKGVQIVYTDQTSVDALDPRVLVRDSMPMGSDPEAKSVAQWLSILFGEQRQRIDGVSFDPAKSSSLAEELFGFELRDVVTLQQTRPGDNLDALCAIEHINVEIPKDPDGMEVVWSAIPLTDAEQGPFFQLDVSALDSDAALA